MTDPPDRPDPVDISPREQALAEDRWARRRGLQSDDRPGPPDQPDPYPDSGLY